MHLSNILTTNLIDHVYPLFLELLINTRFDGEKKYGHPI